MTTGGIGSQVTATLIDESGAVLRRVQSSSWIGLGGSAAGSDGSSFLLAIATSNRFPFDLHVVKVTAEGDVVSDRIIRYEPGPMRAPRMVWTGTHYELLFTTGFARSTCGRVCRVGSADDARPRLWWSLGTSSE